MLKRLVLRLVVLAVLIGVVAAVVPGIHFHGGFLWLLWVAIIFAVINLVLGPLFMLLSLPFIVLTLGLFLLVINAALLAITAALTTHLDVDNFGAALLGGFLIAVLSWLAQLLLPLRRDRSGRKSRRSSAERR